jgi:hypothetical protein
MPNMPSTDPASRASEKDRGGGSGRRAHPLDLHPKVAAVGTGSLLATVVLWLIGLTGLQVPVNVSAAITGLIAGALAWLAPRTSSMVAGVEQLGEEAVHTPLSAVS